MKRILHTWNIDTIIVQMDVTRLDHTNSILVSLSEPVQIAFRTRAFLASGRTRSPRSQSETGSAAT